jgi:hypothetical protein
MERQRPNRPRRNALVQLRTVERHSKLLDKMTIGSLVLLLEAKLKTKKYRNKNDEEVISFYISVNKIKILAEKKA